MNILIVDDEIDQLESLARGLKGRKYCVFEAQGAGSALSVLDDRNLRIDLVITDYAMPHVDGIELLRTIRTRYDYIPVIIMTGYGNKDMIIEAVRNSCDSFIEKPFTLAQLLEEIHRVEENLRHQHKAHPLFKILPKAIHQLNNPMMVIKGSAELSLLQLDNPEVLRRYISRILEAVERMDLINRELLTLSLHENREPREEICG